MLPAYSLHLDLIRGLASLVVFYGHLHLIVTGHGSIASDSHNLNITTHPGDSTALPHAAVLVFFVLSGYLVGGSVLRDLQRNTFSWVKYAVRRLVRLWIVLIPALLLGIVVDGTTTRFFTSTHLFATCYFTGQLDGLPSLSNFLRYLFFFQTIERFPVPRFGTNGALWSLSCEFWYYLVFPLVATSLVSIRAPRVFRVGSVLLAAFILWFAGSRIGLSFPVWLLGAAIYLMPAKIPARLQMPVNLALVLQFCLVLYLLRSIPMVPYAADTSLAVSFALLLYGILHRVSFARQSWYSRLAQCVSMPSYTLYACHIPISVLLAALLEAKFPSLFHHTALAVIVIFGLVLIYAGFIYWLFERNTDRVRRFIEQQFDRRQTSRIRSSALAG